MVTPDVDKATASILNPVDAEGGGCWESWIPQIGYKGLGRIFNPCRVLTIGLYRVHTGVPANSGKKWTNDLVLI